MIIKKKSKKLFWLFLQKVKVIQSESSNLAYLRNLGLKHASSSHVIFIDDDIKPNKKFLVSIEKYLKKKPIVVGMNIRNTGNSFVSQFLAEHRYKVLNKEIVKTPLTAFCYINKKYMLKENLLFDVRFKKSFEDVDFFYRITQIYGVKKIIITKKF